MAAICEASNRTVAKPTVESAGFARKWAAFLGGAILAWAAGFVERSDGDDGFLYDPWILFDRDSYFARRA
jgi:hypothetical protein